MNFDLKKENSIPFQHKGGWKFYCSEYPGRDRFSFNARKNLSIVRYEKDPSLFGPKYGPRSEVLCEPFNIDEPIAIEYTVELPDVSRFHETIFQFMFEQNHVKIHPAAAIMIRGDTVKLRRRRQGKYEDIPLIDWDLIKGTTASFRFTFNPTTNRASMEGFAEGLALFGESWSNFCRFKGLYKCYYSFGLYSTRKKPDYDVGILVKDVKCYSLSQSRQEEVKEYPETDERSDVYVRVDDILEVIKELLYTIKDAEE